LYFFLDDAVAIPAAILFLECEGSVLHSFLGTKSQLFFIDPLQVIDFQ
jgi:hypothetical protein